VKARRLAIDSAKQALDTALAHQASSQKEVVALLERKHSWSNGDLERYMALIRSEHINDQAVREAKDSVADAESALEDARAQLEKRERAQYHEEQIWSDTIRRNSTWVTFGLMGVNIFLLLLSLAILEPWRRRRMVREIKNALEAQQKIAMEASAAPAPALVAAGVPASTQQNLAAIEEEIEEAIKPAVAPVEVAAPVVVEEEVIAESPTAGLVDPPLVEPEVVPIAMPQSGIDTTPDPAVPGAAPLMPEEAEATPQESINIPEEVESSPDTYSKTYSELETWQEKATFIAQDIVSDRVISMPRIDYTTAILQGAAAGAVITAAIISMLRN
jgi:sensitive to high expression protein 9